MISTKAVSSVEGSKGSLPKLEVNSNEVELSKNMRKPEGIRPSIESRSLTEGNYAVEISPLIQKESSKRIKEKAVTLTFKNLTYSVQVKNSNKQVSNSKCKIFLILNLIFFLVVRREILRELTGVCRPGELTAIMGASGAGKTTLLNILSCRASITGTNKLGGEVIFYLEKIFILISF